MRPLILLAALAALAGCGDSKSTPTGGAGPGTMKPSAVPKPPPLPPPPKAK